MNTIIKAIITAGITPTAHTISKVIGDLEIISQLNQEMFKCDDLAMKVEWHALISKCMINNKFDDMKFYFLICGISRLILPKKDGLHNVNNLIYLGYDSYAPIPTPSYHELYKEDSFAIQGSHTSILVELFTDILQHHISKGLGLIYINASEDELALSNITYAVKRFNREKDYIKRTHLNFNLVDALEKNKIIYINLNQSNLSQKKLNDFAIQLQDTLTKINHPYAPFGVFTHHCEALLTPLWLDMQQNSIQNSQWINFFHMYQNPIFFTPEILKTATKHFFYNSDAFLNEEKEELSSIFEEMDSHTYFINQSNTLSKYTYHI